MFNFIKVEITKLRYAWKLLVRVTAHKVVMERVNNRTAVKLDELRPQYLVHPFNVGSMSPVGIVDASEGYSFSLAVESSQHHMCRVDRVNEVRWESRVLLLLVDWLLV